MESYVFQIFIMLPVLMLLASKLLTLLDSSNLVAQLTEDALRFGGACNGILRADACLYQELFLGGTSDDCLEGIGMP